MRTRHFTALAAALAAGIAATPVAVARVDALPIAPLGPPARIVNIESDLDYDDTTTPGGTVVYAVTTPTDADAGFGWWLRIDVRVENTGDAALSVTGFTLDTNVTSPELITLDDPVTVNAGSSKNVLVPSGIADTDGPMPTSLTVHAHLAGYGVPATKTVTLAPFESPTASGGYAFPARSNDLPAGAFWSVGAHAHVASQRYAYDFGARRWDAVDDRWTGYTATATTAAANGGPALGTQNAQWLIWNRPVYALADATIVRCRRTAADNVPGESTPGGGNGVILDMGDGTFVAYYHLRQFSVPAALCPVEGAVGDDQTPIAIPVTKGQFLGRVGNSGHSSGPHLHLQLTDSPSSETAGLRSLPLRFTGIAVHASSGYDPETDDSDWYEVGPDESGVPVNALIDPPCGGPGCAFQLG